MPPLTQSNYRESLRAYLKDTTTFNRILKFKEENENDFLDLYLEMALGVLNTMPPLIPGFDYGTFPVPSLLLHRATIEALISNSIVQSRNDLTYNNGGITVKVDDRDRYLPILQVLFRQHDVELSMFKNIKIAINIDTGFGGSHSPYAYLSGRSRSLNPNSILSG